MSQETPDHKSELDPVEITEHVNNDVTAGQEDPDAATELEDPEDSATDSDNETDPEDETADLAELDANSDPEDDPADPEDANSDPGDTPQNSEAQGMSIFIETGDNKYEIRIIGIPSDTRNVSVKITLPGNEERLDSPVNDTNTEEIAPVNYTEDQPNPYDTVIHPTTGFANFSN